MQSATKIQIIAESLLDSFIPKDKNATTLSFCFTIPPSESYEAHFVKNNDKWEFVRSERQFPDS